MMIDEDFMLLSSSSFFNVEFSDVIFFAFNLYLSLWILVCIENFSVKDSIALRVKFLPFMYIVSRFINEKVCCLYYYCIFIFLLTFLAKMLSRKQICRPVFYDFGYCKLHQLCKSRHQISWWIAVTNYKLKRSYPKMRDLN